MPATKNPLRKFYASTLKVLLLLLSSNIGWAQQTAPILTPEQTEAIAASIRELQEQVRELRATVGEMRSEAARYRAESTMLRRELQAITQFPSFPGRTQQTQPGLFASPSLAESPENSGLSQEQATTPSLEGRVTRLEEESQLQGGKIDEQYQTKVESASKYRVRLSGIVLLNLFSNRGSVDNQDIPNFAVGSNAFDARGNLGATLRQSELGLEVFGPRLAGARTSGDIQFDLGGGFPDMANGITSGLVRLRTGTMRLEWAHTSVVAGQDNIFFSPLSPTSFASLVVPSFGYAGNLWAWVPQVRVEHLFDLSRESSMTLQWGILDNLTGEPPTFQSQRVPQAGERSNQPGYGVRVAWTHPVFGQPMTVGGGGYYGRQDWGFNRYVDGWAGAADWDIPLAHWLNLSGEFYSGDAVGGLGGDIGRSVVFSDVLNDPTARVQSVDSVGGWSQLKFKPTSRLQFNGTFGLDEAVAQDLRAFSTSPSNSTLARNRGSFLNFIYRPYSNLLFSMDYRRLRSHQVNGDSHTAGQVNLMMGVLF